MKKRTIISIILMVVCVFLTNKFWIVFEPLDVSFNAYGKDLVNFEILLSNKNNNDFNRYKIKSQLVDLSKNNLVKMSVDRSKFPKRLKITINPQSSSKTITISNIQFRNGKYKITNLKNFIFDKNIVQHKVENNSLIITTNNEIASIIYNKPLNVKAKIDFDLKMFILILILSFLLAYKLTDYLADFKTVDNHSRIDIIFLLLFFILLFIPMSKIDKGDISEQENRPLAKFQSIIIDDKINYNFSKNFDSWFSDRFALRDILIRFYYFQKSIMSSNFYENNLGVLYKKNNWMFTKSYYATFDKVPQGDLSKAEQAIKRLNVFCKQNNIKLYVLISPIKEDIYREKNVSYLLKDKKDNVYPYIDLLKKNNIDTVYFRDEMLEAKNKDYVFFKADQHWTDYGAYTGYRALMKDIKKDYPSVPIFSEDDYNYQYNKLIRWDYDKKFEDGSTYQALNLHNDKIYDVNYRYFEHKNSQQMQIIKDKESGIRTKEFYYPLGLNKRVLLLGTSFVESFTEFLPYSFQHVKRLRRLEMLKHEKTILRYKPDIMVICLSSYDVRMFLKDLYEEGNN